MNIEVQRILMFQILYMCVSYAPSLILYNNALIKSIFNVIKKLPKFTFSLACGLPQVDGREESGGYCKE